MTVPLIGGGEEISEYCSALWLELGDGMASKSPRSINELPDFVDLDADLDPLKTSRNFLENSPL